MSSTPKPDLILVNGRFTTLDLQKPQAEAVAVHAGKFIAVGSKQDVMSTGAGRHAGTSRIATLRCAAAVAQLFHY